MTVAEALQTGSEALGNASVASPERESSLLLRHVLQCDAAFLYAHPEHRLNAVQSILFKAVLKRRASHEPFQYISGVQEFYGLEFEVTPEVLIPRPETEILVEAAISEFRDAKEVRFCEIGVGSGCISISILANLPLAAAIGVDVSRTALNVARQNAGKHGVAERLGLLESDVFQTVDTADFDLIVSNPPYVPDTDVETLQHEVRSFEPRSALEGGADGLDIVRRIVEDSPKFLRQKGLLLIEIGWDQSKAVRELLEPEIWDNVQFLPDLQGIPRILKAFRR